MTGIRDLSRYVERYPDDHEQRWRLVKKLYLACEYPLALQHLLILKNHWPAKLNVIRYMAATYYRLGRYDEAIEELQAARRNWPQVVALCEQLARVYEVSGRRQQACAMWETILEEDPRHPAAHQAIQRLQTPPDTGSDDDLKLQDSDSGIAFDKSFICAECGAQNSEEFVTCWQCGVQLHRSNHKTPAGMVKGGSSGNKLDTRLPIPAVAWAAAVMLVAAGAFLTHSFVNQEDGYSQFNGVSLTVYGLLNNEIWITRLVLAGVLVAAWPAALYVTAAVLGLTLRSPHLIAPAGIGLAAVTYLGLWLPPNLIGLAPLGVGLCSLLVCLGIFRASFAINVLGWLVHQGLVVLAGAGVLLAIEGGEPLRQWNAIAAHSTLHDHAVDPGQFRANVSHTPVDIGLTWESTGSPWLDLRAATSVIGIGLRGEGHNQVTARLWRNQAIVRELRLRVDETHHMFVDAAPGTKYRLEVTGETTPLDLKIYGVLTPRFIH